MTNLLKIILFAVMFLSACKGVEPENGNDVTKPEVETVTVYVTSSDRTYAFSKMELNFSKPGDLPASTVILDVGQRFQTMHGFGAALTGSACYNLMKMSPQDRNRFLTNTFSEEGMAYSYMRISIGCSDFSLSEYTLCDVVGIENFALTSEETDYVIPVLKEILAINPDLKIMGSPWTSPRWMKVNNLTDLQPHVRWTGGHLNPAYYQDYAAYFVKWIQAFADEGISITSVTPQNEPLWHGNSASLLMFWEEQRDFVNDALVPQFIAAGLNTKIYLYDHNYHYANMSDQMGYPAKIYEAGVNNDIVAGAAFHNYGGNRSELLNIHSLFPDKELVFTEASIGQWNNGKDLSQRLIPDMREVALGTVNNWCSAVIVWNLMLDENMGPNRPGGCLTCYGSVDIAADYRTLTYNSHYYIIGHLSAVVKPGAVRIATTGMTDTDIVISAFKNTDNSHAVVLFNSSQENKPVRIADAEKSFMHVVPARSVVSYIW